MNDYYFDGDPAVDSTRRQLERLLQGQPSRGWPWVVAALAGGTAFTIWRIRAHRSKAAQSGTDAPAKATPDVQHG